MFEQSLLLPAESGAKARALALSLTTQTAAAGVLLLIPLIYTERLAMGHITLPTTLSLMPKPPAPQAAERPAARPRRSIARIFREFFVPTTIPKLNTNPEIVDEPSLVDPLTFDAALPLPTALIPRINSGDTPPPPLVKPAAIEQPQKPVTVGGTVLAAKLIHRVVPVYPISAKLARVSGTVRLIGVVSEEGIIQQLQVISGNPLLIQAALDAVRQWVYSPTLLNGKSVEVSAPIDVIFTLSQ
ncbi:MAG: TonB family protein [Bryobacteraceae bacterium]